MRTNLLVVAFLVFVYLPVKSSAQAVQGGGPTLAETMAFLNEKLQQRGTLEYAGTLTISSEGFSGAGCEQTYRSVIEQNRSYIQLPSEQGIRFAILRLDQADVSSVAILEPERDRNAFAVAVNKIAYSEQAAFQPHPPVEFDLRGSGGFSNGQVQSVDATSVTWLPENSGHPQRMTPDRSVTFYLGKNDYPKPHPKKGKLADISPGDKLTVSEHHLSYGYSTDVYVEKVTAASAPVMQDPEVILPATRQVGSERKQFTFGYTKDRDDAERMAKAIIHAVVLCQANATPSLF